MILLFIAETILAGIFYYLGYCAYTGGNIAATVCCALACGGFLLHALKNLKWSRYPGMTMKKIDKLSGEAFEQYLCVQFRRLGYRVRITDASHDYGADLILKKRGKCIVVQAKRYDRNIGITAVQEAAGAVAFYQADQAMVVTNRYFTKSAWNLARQNDVILWGRDEIRRRFRIRGS